MNSIGILTGEPKKTFMIKCVSSFRQDASNMVNEACQMIADAYVHPEWSKEKIEEYIEKMQALRSLFEDLQYFFDGSIRVWEESQ